MFLRNNFALSKVLGTRALDSASREKYALDLMRRLPDYTPPKTALREHLASRSKSASQKETGKGSWVVYIVLFSAVGIIFTLMQSRHKHIAIVMPVDNGEGIEDEVLKAFRERKLSKK